MSMAEYQLDRLIEAEAEIEQLKSEIEQLKKDRYKILGEFDSCHCMGDISKVLRQYGF